MDRYHPRGAKIQSKAVYASHGRGESTGRQRVSAEFASDSVASQAPSSGQSSIGPVLLRDARHLQTSPIARCNVSLLPLYMPGHVRWRAHRAHSFPSILNAEHAVPCRVARSLFTCFDLKRWLSSAPDSSPAWTALLSRPEGRVPLRWPFSVSRFHFVPHDFNVAHFPSSLSLAACKTPPLPPRVSSD